MFEWDFGSRLVFSISIGRDGTLTYAGLFGHTKVRRLYQTVWNVFLPRLDGRVSPNETIYGHYVLVLRGKSHTNSIDGYWSLLKRSILSTHIHVSRKHLPKYLGEFDFRHNTRSMTDRMYRLLVGLLKVEQPA